MWENNDFIKLLKETTIIIININTSKLFINREFINNNITPNFTVEMFYYVLCELIKYNNYKLSESINNYIFEGYYNEPYDQGDEIHIMIII